MQVMANGTKNAEIPNCYFPFESFENMLLLFLKSIFAAYCIKKVVETWLKSPQFIQFGHSTIPFNYSAHIDVLKQVKHELYNDVIKNIGFALEVGLFYEYSEGFWKARFFIVKLILRCR